MSAAQTGPSGMGTSGTGTSGDGANPREAAREVGREAKAEARRLRDEVSEGARRQAEERKDAAGAYLHTLATAVSGGAEAFHRDGRDGTGTLLDRAADEITHFADRLAGRRPEDILRDVESFARRHPAVFFGSAALLAFGATRMLKASAPPEDRDVEVGAQHGAATPVMGATGAGAPTSRGEVF